MSVRAAALLFASLTGLACATHGTMYTADAGHDDVIVLYVANEHSAPVHVDLVYGGDSQRLGTVPAAQRRLYEIPVTDYGRPIRAHLVLTSMTMGAPSVRYPVSLRPECDLEFWINPKLRGSRLTVARP